MFRVNGTINGASVSSSNTSQPLTLTLSTGPTTQIFTAPETGYYIISLNLNSTSPTVNAVNKTIAFMLTIPLQSQVYWSEQVATPSIPISGTNYTITVNFCMCIFFRVNDVANFFWRNLTGITNTCSGKFCITRVCPTEAITADLTCTAIAASKPTLYAPLTITPTEATNKILNNRFTCTSDGIYFISAFVGGETTNIPSVRYTLAFSVNDVRYYGEQFVNQQFVNAGNYLAGYPKLCKIVPLKSGDVITLYFVNPGGLALGCRNGSCTIIKLL